jgi:hypothetical protein
MRTALLLGSLVLAAPVLGACRGDACILKICQGSRCRCSISSCSDGAAYDTKQNRCRCLKGYNLVGGQCLNQEDANAYCGRGFYWDAATAGCNRGTCKPGDELDESTGMCIPQQQVNQVATNMGVPVGQGQKLGCPAGTKLVIDGQKAACVPIPSTCARDETWTGTACVKVSQCPNGAVYDTALGQCVQYASGGDSKELTVNVAQWTNANYGPNGGTGTTAFCGQFAKKPWSFGVVEGQTAVVQIQVMLSFPGNEVAKGVVQTTTTFAASGNQVPQKGAADVDAAAKTIFGTLQQGGGRANANTAATTVRCSVINAAKPVPVPATGGV